MRVLRYAGKLRRGPSAGEKIANRSRVVRYARSSEPPADEGMRRTRGATLKLRRGAVASDLRASLALLAHPFS
jgi:hypothetical protein